MALHGAIVLLVLASLWAASQGFEAKRNLVYCCVNVSYRRVSMRIVDDYYEHDATDICVKAVVLITDKGRSICVPPDAQWVQKIKLRIDMRKQRLEVNPPPEE